MHSSASAEAAGVGHSSNNGAAAEADAAQDATGPACESLYNEPEDPTGTRQTLIQVCRMQQSMLTVLRSAGVLACQKPASRYFWGFHRSVSRLKSGWNDVIDGMSCRSGPCSTLPKRTSFPQDVLLRCLASTRRRNGGCQARVMYATLPTRRLDG